MKTHISRCQALPLQNITVIRKSDFLSNCLENQLLGRDGSRLDTKKTLTRKELFKKNGIIGYPNTTRADLFIFFLCTWKYELIRLQTIGCWPEFQQNILFIFLVSVK